MSVRTIPLLPCRDLDDVLPFYLTLGFQQTYRQARPNPYLCVSRGDGFDLHFFGLPGYDVENSIITVIVSVPGPEWATVAPAPASAPPAASSEEALVRSMTLPAAAVSSRAAMLVSAMTRPLPATTTWSAVSSSSLIR